MGATGEASACPCCVDHSQSPRANRLKAPVPPIKIKLKRNFTTMGKLFGTDGIRGKANAYPLTADMATIIGRATALFFTQPDTNRPPVIVLGRDTRESGEMLEEAFSRGACSAGANVLLTSVLPTPGIACLTVAQKADVGVVISASHNPYTDNGFKFFDDNGHKLSENQETELERIILELENDSPVSDGTGPGRAEPLSDAGHAYIDFLKQAVSAGPDKPLKLVLDCANGATAHIAGKIFPDAHLLFNTPDGININNQCGSEHPEVLAKTVTDTGADAGFAFDGDGDRVIAIDEAGKQLTGDQLLAFSAEYLKNTGQLKNNTMVSTVMSNIGLSQALTDMGIEHIKTPVGDRHVAEAMRSVGASLGGEDSGHTIFGDFQTTGDSLLAALMVCRIMRETGRSLYDLAQCMKVYPQVLINVEVREKPKIETIPEICTAIDTVTAELGDSGRVLVRYSGTQSICRVMVEGPEEEQTMKYAEQIAEAVQMALGA